MYKTPSGVHDSKLFYKEFCTGFEESVENRDGGSFNLLLILTTCGDVKLTRKLNIYDLPGSGAPGKSTYEITFILPFYCDLNVPTNSKWLLYYFFGSEDTSWAQTDEKP
jgi:hypothetical protein